MSARLREPGDDVVVHVRLRRANVPALERGVTLGIDTLTRERIVLRLVPREDEIHDLEVETGAMGMAGAPEPVNAELVGEDGDG